MVIKLPHPPLSSASPDRFRIQRHFRLFKSTEPILFTYGARRPEEGGTGRRTEGNQTGNERRRINLRQTVPSKRGMQMAPGAISNFTILKVVGATFSAYHTAYAAATFTPTLLLPLRLPFTRFSVPLSTSRIYPSQCPAKKFSFPEIAPCTVAARARRFPSRSLNYYI